MRKLWLGMFLFGLTAWAAPWSARESASSPDPVRAVLQVVQPAEQTPSPGDRAYDELGNYLER